MVSPSLGHLPEEFLRVEAPLKSCPIEKPSKLFISIQETGNGYMESVAGMPNREGMLGSHLLLLPSHKWGQTGGT